MSRFNDLITTVNHKTTSKPGRACVHRAKFLDELIKLIHPSTASFNKSLISITEVPSTGLLSLSFVDGTTTTVSAVIACDGIKSVARQSYVLSEVEDQKLLRPVFENEFAYRGMFPREKFIEITDGQLDAGRGTIFCGHGGYVGKCLGVLSPSCSVSRMYQATVSCPARNLCPLGTNLPLLVMYPVEKGTLMNVVAVKHIDPSFPGYPELLHEKDWVQPVSSETMLDDFSTWGEPIKALLRNIQKPDRWALYDHLPAPTYVKGRVALVGDSAHATTPHQGQGAGMAFEDSFVLSSILGEILNEPLAATSDKREAWNLRLEACFKAYDEVRRPRTQEVTRTSREMGDMIEYLHSDIGTNLVKLKENLEGRMAWIWEVDLNEEVDRGVTIAKDELRSSLSQIS